jgi:hypothetical protein
MPGRWLASARLAPALNQRELFPSEKVPSQARMRTYGSAANIHIFGDVAVGSTELKDRLLPS